MTDKNDNPPRLSELHIDTIRRENDHVDERLEEYEATISDLESQVDQLEDEKADLEEEKEATEQLLADFREEQRQKQLNRIREANEAVAEETEVDLSTLEDAGVDTLETVADMLESASGAAEPSNADRTPDVGSADPDPDSDGASDLESAKQQVAEEFGLASMYEKAREGDIDVDYTAMGSMTGDGMTGGDIIDAATEGDR